MSELKTLKDLKREENNGPASMGGDEIVEVKELKQEAIKWVKADCDFNDWRLLFKKFHNITEEDLKNL